MSKLWLNLNWSPDYIVKIKQILESIITCICHKKVTGNSGKCSELNGYIFQRHFYSLGWLGVGDPPPSEVSVESPSTRVAASRASLLARTSPKKSTKLLSLSRFSNLPTKSLYIGHFPPVIYYMLSSSFSSCHLQSP